ncbi:tyrosine-protein kinase STYK1-like [Scyliorhinus torazame]|uniref:tyrosine-protein kinase STYK1-like n=1 Tax=Scyliorhinus torazame TaxID=75743 RepID=UPI003B5A83F6
MVSMASDEPRNLDPSSSPCAKDNQLCVVRRYESEIIIVPVLLLGASFFVGVYILWMICRRKREGDSEPQRGPSGSGRTDRGITRHNLTLGVSSPNGAHMRLDPVLSQWQIPHERLVGGLKWITQGRFGTIYQTQLTSGEAGKERTVVLKEFNESVEAPLMSEFLARVKFHAFLGQHPNLVEMIGCCTDRPPLYLVLGNMNRGNLLQFLWTCRKDVMKLEEAPYDVTERQIYNIAIQVASGLEFLQQKGLIHGDVAARNILLSDDFNAKLTGLHIPFEIQRAGVIRSHVSVPIKWQSPERIMKKPLTPKSDV